MSAPANPTHAEPHRTSLRLPRPLWLGVIACVLILAGAGLRWWTARATIWETHRLGGWFAVAPTSLVFGPFEKILAVDAAVNQISFQETAVPHDYFDRYLRNLSSLEAVSLHKCTISDSDIDRLREVATLRDLILDESDVTGTMASALSEMKQLRGLRLTGTKITDGALPDLGRLTNLESLGLSRTSVGDSGLPSLKGLTKVYALDLSHTNVTDDGLVHLHGLTTLRWLSLSGTRVTDAAVADLKRVLPGLIVVK